MRCVDQVRNDERQHHECNVARGRHLCVGVGTEDAGLAGVSQLLERGHATASTDDGHQAIPIDGTWAIGQPEKVRDFAERAVHVTSDIAKAIVARFHADDDPRKPVQRTLPLCPYPNIAKWDGKGDINRSESFKCAARR